LSSQYSPKYCFLNCGVSVLADERKLLELLAFKQYYQHRFRTQASSNWHSAMWTHMPHASGYCNLFSNTNSIAVLENITPEAGLQ
jgi:hypothetical protein